MTRLTRPTPRFAACALLVVGLMACGDGRTDPDRPIGRRANDLLSDTTYTSLVVEVDHMPGAEPSQTALDLLEQRLNERCNKPQGIRFVTGDVIPAGKGTYGLSDVSQLEATHRDTRASGTEASLYVLYLNGRSVFDSGQGKTLGWAYASSSICLFAESAGSVADPSAPAGVESAILVHELGHVFGLVNSGTNMVESHEDLYHPGHDTNSDCVMHYEVESPRVRNIFGQRVTTPTQFSANCLQDLKAAGGK
jgi:hypothetical protein